MRIIQAWLLVAVFAIPLITKSIHICENEFRKAFCARPEDSYNNRDNSNTCPVCLFTLSHFTTNDFANTGHIQTISKNQTYPLNQEKEYISVVGSYYLRAPPVIAG